MKDERWQLVTFLARLNLSSAKKFDYNSYIVPISGYYHVAAIGNISVAGVLKATAPRNIHMILDLKTHDQVTTHGRFISISRL